MPFKTFAILFIQVILHEVIKNNQLEIIIVWNKNKLPAHEE